MVSRDLWVLEIVNHGLKIEFVTEPIQSFRSGDVLLRDRETEICDQEILSLLEKKAIEFSLEPHQTSFLISFFVIPKKDGKYRSVHNLKMLKRVVVYRHFKMEGNSMLKHLVKQGDWFAKIDLRDAYLTVPIHPTHRRFLQLKWRYYLYQLTCLPFGLSYAPWMFSKLLKPVAAYLRRHGIRLIINLDGMLIMSSEKDRLIQEFNFVKSVLEYIGFIFKTEKSLSEPVQDIEFFGLLVNSLNLSVSLPKEKVTSVIQFCAEALSKVSI